MKNFIIIFIALFLASCGSGNIENISQKNENISEKTIAQNEVKRDLEAEILALEKEYAELLDLENKAFETQSDELLRKYSENNEKISQKFDSLLFKKHFYIFNKDKEECFEINEKKELQNGFFVELTCNLVKLYYQDKEMDVFSTTEFLKRNAVDFDFLRSYSREYILENSYSFAWEDRNNFMYFVALPDEWEVEEGLPSNPEKIIIDTKNKKLVAKRGWVSHAFRFDEGYILQRTTYVDPIMRLEIMYDSGVEYSIDLPLDKFMEFLEKNNKMNGGYSMYDSLYISWFKKVEWWFSMAFRMNIDGNIKTLEIFADRESMH